MLARSEYGDVVIIVPDEHVATRFHVLHHPEYKIRQSCIRLDAWLMSY